MHYHGRAAATSVALAMKIMMYVSAFRLKSGMSLSDQL